MESLNDVPGEVRKQTVGTQAFPLSVGNNKLGEGRHGYDAGTQGDSPGRSKP